MNHAPGAFRQLVVGGNDCMPASTHGLSLSFVGAHIESAARKTILISMELTGMPFGEGLSPGVECGSRAERTPSPE